MILYSKPQKATFPMPKKSRPTAQKRQSKFREKQKRRKLNTIRREHQLKNGEVPQEKETDRACHYTYYYYTKQTLKNRRKKHKHTVPKPHKRKKSHFLKKNPQITCTLYFFAIPLHHQTRRDHILVGKTNLERWQSGRLHRS